MKKTSQIAALLLAAGLASPALAAPPPSPTTVTCNPALSDSGVSVQGCLVDPFYDPDYSGFVVTNNGTQNITELVIAVTSGNDSLWGAIYPWGGVYYDEAAWDVGHSGAESFDNLFGTGFGGAYVFFGGTVGAGQTLGDSGTEDFYFQVDDATSAGNFGFAAYSGTTVVAQSYTAPTSAVPEPESWALLTAGLGLLAAGRRRAAARKA